MAVPVSCLVLWASIALANSRSFTIDYDQDTFLKDGKPFRYISGSMHYSRVPSYYWKDRLSKLRYAGLNAVQTYVPWNFHEPFPGMYNFEGDHDLVKFLTTAQEVGLLVILRAGPYICAEWEMGGFPSWLLRDKDISLRSTDQNYLNAVDEWMDKLLSLVRPLLYENGGPVITVQVENEYGSYSTCDPKYLEHLEDLFRKNLGPNVVLFTTDGAGDGFLKCGTISSLYSTVDFGVSSPDQIEKYFQFQRKYQPHGPLVNSEFYTGWLDHWGQSHSTTSAQQVADSLDAILSLNASVNMYMFEGGTNFAFWNGANGGSGSYMPQPTSYDYDAPLNERGALTDKYILIRNVIKKYLPVPTSPVPPTTDASLYNGGSVEFKYYSDLFESSNIFTKQVVSDRPLTFEDMEQDYGFMLYTTVNDVTPSQSTFVITVGGVRDRASVYWNRELVGIITRTGGAISKQGITVDAGITKGSIAILVENMGRINYGTYINDRKGILDGVYLDDVEILNWKSSSIPLNNTEKLKFSPIGNNPYSSVFFKGTFTIDNGSIINDTYLDTTNWMKGVAFVNNFNLGRYWPNISKPQKALFVPANVLKFGLNEVILFEIGPIGSNVNMHFATKPIWS